MYPGNVKRIENSQTPAQQTAMIYTMRYVANQNSTTQHYSFNILFTCTYLYV